VMNACSFLRSYIVDFFESTRFTYVVRLGNVLGSSVTRLSTACFVNGSRAMVHDLILRECDESQ
jgi:hypothetical protein